MSGSKKHLGAALLERRSGTEFQPLSPALLIGNDEIRCLEPLKPDIAVQPGLLDFTQWGLLRI